MHGDAEPPMIYFPDGGMSLSLFYSLKKSPTYLHAARFTGMTQMYYK
jgi:hypothetical protein